MATIGEQFVVAKVDAPALEETKSEVAQAVELSDTKETTANGDHAEVAGEGGAIETPAAPNSVEDVPVKELKKEETIAKSEVGSTSAKAVEPVTKADVEHVEAKEAPDVKKTEVVEIPVNEIPANVEPKDKEPEAPKAVAAASIKEEKPAVVKETPIVKPVVAEEPPKAKEVVVTPPEVAAKSEGSKTVAAESIVEDVPVAAKSIPEPKNEIKGVETTTAEPEAISTPAETTKETPVAKLEPVKPIAAECVKEEAPVAAKLVPEEPKKEIQEVDTTPAKPEPVPAPVEVIEEPKGKEPTSTKAATASVVVDTSESKTVTEAVVPSAADPTHVEAVITQITETKDTKVTAVATVSTTEVKDGNDDSLLEKAEHYIEIVGTEVYKGAGEVVETIKQHPELIAEGVIAVAIAAASLIQPELIAGEIAIIGKMASDAARTTGTQIAQEEAKKIASAIGKDVSEDKDLDGVKDVEEDKAKEAEAKAIDPAAEAPKVVEKEDRDAPKTEDKPKEDGEHIIALEVAQDGEKDSDGDGKPDAPAEPVSLKITIGADGAVKSVTQEKMVKTDEPKAEETPNPVQTTEHEKETTKALIDGAEATKVEEPVEKPKEVAKEPTPTPIVVLTEPSPVEEESAANEPTVPETIAEDKLADFGEPSTDKTEEPVVEEKKETPIPEVAPTPETPAPEVSEAVVEATPESESAPEPIPEATPEPIITAPHQVIHAVAKPEMDVEDVKPEPVAETTEAESDAKVSDIVTPLAATAIAAGGIAVVASASSEKPNEVREVVSESKEAVSAPKEVVSEPTIVTSVAKDVIPAPGPELVTVPKESFDQLHNRIDAMHDAIQSLTQILATHPALITPSPADTKTVVPEPESAVIAETIPASEIPVPEGTAQIPEPAPEVEMTKGIQEPTSTPAETKTVVLEPESAVIAETIPASEIPVPEGTAQIPEPAPEVETTKGIEEPTSTPAETSTSTPTEATETSTPAPEATEVAKSPAKKPAHKKRGSIFGFLWPFGGSTPAPTPAPAPVAANAEPTPPSTAESEAPAPVDNKGKAVEVVENELTAGVPGAAA